MEERGAAEGPRRGAEGYRSAGLRRPVRGRRLFEGSYARLSPTLRNGHLIGRNPTKGPDHPMFVLRYIAAELRRRLIADASHELRTPVTSLRTKIELIAGGRLAREEVEGALADAV